MSEMVERVSQAICRPLCQGDAHPCDKDEFGTCKPGKCRHFPLYADSARAAIEAMLPPTEAMIEAGDCRTDTDNLMVQDIYTEMLTAALSPSSGEGGK